MHINYLIHRIFQRYLRTLQMASFRRKACFGTPSSCRIVGRDACSLGIAPRRSSMLFRSASRHNAPIHNSHSHHTTIGIRCPAGKTLVTLSRRASFSGAKSGLVTERSCSMSWLRLEGNDGCVPSFQESGTFHPASRSVRLIRARSKNTSVPYLELAHFGKQYRHELQPQKVWHERSGLWEARQVMTRRIVCRLCPQYPRKTLAEPPTDKSPQRIVRPVWDPLSRNRDWAASSTGVLPPWSKKP